MGTVNTNSVAQLIVDLDGAIQWMADLGVEIGSGRIATYRKIAAEWDALLNGNTNQSVEQLYSRVSTFAYEVPAFLNIYNAFKTVSRKELSLITSQLRKAVNGPWRIEDETNTSPNPARDFLFESLTAAHVHKPQAGCSAILDAPSDTGFVNDRLKVYIECKRLSSANSIDANLKKASQQLVKAFGQRPRTRNRGLIALDASKIIRPPHHILETRTNEDIGAASRRILTGFVGDNMEAIQRRLYPIDRRIIGLLVYFTSVAVASEDQLFVNVSWWTIVRRRNLNPSDFGFLGRLPSLLGS